MQKMQDATVTLRLLAPDDAPAYRALRLRALTEHPEAFTSSAEDEAEKPLAWSVQRLGADAARPHDFFIGAFRGGLLVGMVGLQGQYRPKERHNATVVGLYVAPEAAGQGLGWALMQALLARARALPGLAQLDLTVTEGSPKAQGLYARCGFAVWGVLPRAIRVAGRDHAKVHLALALR